MPEELSDDSEEEIVQRRVEDSESEHSYEEKDSDMEIAARED